jgi:hypothetical protein
MGIYIKSHQSCLQIKIFLSKGDGPFMLPPPPSWAMPTANDISVKKICLHFLKDWLLATYFSNIAPSPDKPESTSWNVTILPGHKPCWDRERRVCLSLYGTWWCCLSPSRSETRRVLLVYFIIFTFGFLNLKFLRIFFRPLLTELAHEHDQIEAWSDWSDFEAFWDLNRLWLEFSRFSSIPWFIYFTQSDTNRLLAQRTPRWTGHKWHCRCQFGAASQSLRLWHHLWHWDDNCVMVLVPMTTGFALVNDG